MVIARALDVSYDVFSEIEGQPVQGAARSKVLFEGEETVLEKITFENGAFSSAHQHPYETIGHILRGRAEVTIGNETYNVGVGDTFRCAKGEPHHLKALEEVTLLEAHARG
jgi:quercetin dioxygenase-like cupin family protein